MCSQRMKQVVLPFGYLPTFAVSNSADVMHKKSRDEGSSLGHPKGTKGRENPGTFHPSDNSELTTGRSITKLVWPDETRASGCLRLNALSVLAELLVESK